MSKDSWIQILDHFTHFWTKTGFVLYAFYELFEKQSDLNAWLFVGKCLTMKNQYEWTEFYINSCLDCCWILCDVFGLMRYRLHHGICYMIFPDITNVVILMGLYLFIWSCNWKKQILGNVYYDWYFMDQNEKLVGICVFSIQWSDTLSLQHHKKSALSLDQYTNKVLWRYLPTKWMVPSFSAHNFTL